MGETRVKQHIPKKLRYTMRDFNADFPSDTACLEYVAGERWPGGIVLCPKCQKKRKHHRVGNRTAYACDYCGHQQFPLAGTIFEHSSTSLRLWFYAIYLMGSTRCGISAKQVQRETGVTYKTAWRMFRQIRWLLPDGDLRLERPTVEIDETYWGGKRKYGTGRPLRGDKKKIPVVAVVQRKGKIVARVIPDLTGDSLLGVVRKHVVPGSTVYTDEAPTYQGIPYLFDNAMERAGFVHHTVKHSAKEYVRGQVHTNNVDGFWSLIKRGIGGVYHQVSPKYLQSYLDEYRFRYSRRFEGNQQFRPILKRVSERAV